MSAKNSKKSTTTSTTSKPSTGSDIDTKKNRWFRVAATARQDFGRIDDKIDNLLDLYWGGPNRHITGLTVRIIAVNALALVLLLVGTLYLGKYERNLIEAKLETFQAEVELVSVAISESSIEEHEKPGTLPFEKSSIVTSIMPEKAQQIVRRLSMATEQRIVLFDANGTLIADSEKLAGPDGEIHIARLNPPQDTLYTIHVLKSMTRFILSFLPERRVLPPYPYPEGNAQEYPDAPAALAGDFSISAWQSREGGVFLSAAAPLIKNDERKGAVLLTREAHDIEAAVGEVWINVLGAFMMTLFVTILLSIYLSGLIASPLRKLALAAEGVRKGKMTYSDIPDLSTRKDEIGELSIALRQMTLALWERMDTIERFAADVAHELKNPLTSLRSAVETAKIIKKKEDQDKLLDIIKHDVDRLDRLISDISSASRLDVELSREALQPIDIRSVLDALLDAYKDPLERKKHDGKNSAQVKGIEIRLESGLAADSVTVLALHGRLEQVFQNLLSNALSFSPPDGVVIMRMIPDGRRVKVTVEDRGPGIPPGKLETVFERFYSERPQHESYGRHSGLGLSICRQIVTALGGEIFAENITGESGQIKGARFTVILPLV